MFKKYHLAICRSDYKALAAPAAGLSIERIPPDFSVYYPLLQRVGAPWGWDRRPKYVFAQAASMQERLAHPETRLYLLKQDDQTVGYCLSTGYFDPLSYVFQQAAGGVHERRQICEIENFGLFPECTGKGYGQGLLPMIFEDLFKAYEVVYLSSRSTNHSKVIDFYKNLGMRVTLVEEMPDDLSPGG